MTRSTSPRSPSGAPNRPDEGGFEIDGAGVVARVIASRIGEEAGELA